MKTLFLLLFPIVLGTIEFPCNALTSPDYSAIRDPHERWRAYGIKSYTILERKSCFCLNGGERVKITVRDNTIVNVQRTNLLSLPREEWSWFLTVEELFDVVERFDSFAYHSVAYDSRYGYPTEIYVDPLTMVADDEWDVQVSDLKKN